MLDREAGRFPALTRWGSWVEAEGAARNGFSDRAGMLAGLLTGEPTQVIFAVLS